MGLVTKRALVCDRCVEPVEVDEDFRSISMADLPEGRHRVGRDRVLCPECHHGHDLLEARHKVELEGYISNATQRMAPQGAFFMPISPRGRVLAQTEKRMGAVDTQRRVKMDIGPSHGGLLSYTPSRPGRLFSCPHGRQRHAARRRKGADVAENDNPQTDPQEEPHGTDWKAESRKWEERSKANRVDLDALKAQLA